MNEHLPGNRSRLSVQRERAFNVPSVVLAIVVLLIAIHLGRAYVLTPDEDLAVILRAAFIPIRYTGDYALDLYAFTSPVTYSLLHGGIDHLVVNLIWLVAFGSPLAQRIGAVRFVLFWVVASLSAVALHFILHMYEMNPLIGASGAIAGMMGAAARFAFNVDRNADVPGFSGPVLPVFDVLRNRGVLFFLGIWMAINVVTGLYSLSPDGGGIAWEAHVGGFLLGFFGIALFDRPGIGTLRRLEMDDRPAHDTPALGTPEEDGESEKGEVDDRQSNTRRKGP